MHITMCPFSPHPPSLVTRKLALGATVLPNNATISPFGMRPQVVSVIGERLRKLLLYNDM
jgi:hypothetical protein